MADERRTYPLSYEQERIWAFEAVMPCTSTYNMAYRYHCKGKLEIALLERSFHAVIQRHDTLRTCFGADDGRPFQIVMPEAVCDWQTIDLSGLPAEARSAGAHRIELEEARRPFDLSRGPLLRLRLVRLSEQEHLLILVIHHLVCDGLSLNVLSQEWQALYRAWVMGERPLLPELPLQYGDYVVEQRRRLQGKVLERHLTYWQQQLVALPGDVLSTDKMRLPLPAVYGGLMLRRLHPELVERLTTFSEQERVTRFTPLLTAFQILLSRYTQNQDIAVGTPVAGRARGNVEALVGLFAKIVILRTNFEESSTFRAAVQRARTTVMGALMHQDLPFDVLSKLLHAQRGPSQPFISLPLFGFYNASDREATYPDLMITCTEIPTGSAKSDLNLILVEGPTGIEGSWEYRTDLFQEQSICQMIDQYEALLEAALANPDQRCALLPVLSEPQQRQILVEWNQTVASYRCPVCIHELFEAQVEQTPDAIAVVCQGEQLTYRALNLRANQLAHYLRRCGVGPEVMVGIAVERSLEMVVGLLGILKAGGAYVPIDPAYPQERIAYMLQDAGLTLLLTHRGLMQQLFAHSAAPQVIHLETDWGLIALESDENPSRSASPENLAYMIYTSGSTGRPKGAMNEHRAICNRLLWMQQQYQLTAADRVLQKTPFSFDVSVWEFFWPLLVGARLVMAKPGGHQDSRYLVDLIQREAITTLHFVPSMLQVFIEEEGVEACRSIRRVICSGEALPYELQVRFFQRLDAALHNLYGPTEAAVDVTHWSCERSSERQIVPIGRPVANTQIYVFDRQMQPVPIGVAGELYIGGVQVGRGYWNRPHLTAERFVPAPFAWRSNPFHSDRLYKTGDLVRYLPDGAIEYLGRIDQQMKLRGYRIEPGEIEAIFMQHPAVQEALVMCDAYGLDDQRLIAYVVPHAQRTRPLRQLLRLQREGVLHARNRYELPDGRIVAHQNRRETEFLYREIFEDQTYLRHNIRLPAGACVFDIGANIGLFTLFVADICKEPTIYAFEPIPPLYELLQINASLSGAAVKLYACGLSSTNRRERFTYYPHNTIMSGHYAGTSDEQAVVRRYMLNQYQGAISVTELDDLVADRMQHEEFLCELTTISDIIRANQVQRIDLLKIDVEKAEWDVLQGIAEQDWPKIQQIVIEVHDIDGRLAQITSLLAEHGFIVTVEQNPLLHQTALYDLYALRPVEAPMPIPDEAGDRVAQWASPTQMIAALRRYAKEHLPAHMIPAEILLLDSMPLTPNGKVDRQALPKPQPTQAHRATAEAPRNPVEEILVGIWAQLLQHPQVGIHTNFFDAGGHSLLATQAVARIRKSLHWEDVEVRSLFEAPTPAALATRMREVLQHRQRVDLSPIRPSPRHQAELPLSFAQQRLWFFDQLEPGDPSYNITRAIKLTGPLDTETLERCFQAIVWRHESLRTTFHTIEGRPVQVIATQVGRIMPVIDLRTVALQAAPADAAAAIEQHLQALMRAETMRPFNLTCDLMLRATLLRIDTETHVLLLTLHHIAADGWSLGVLTSEISAHYAAYIEGRPSPLPALPIQYADYGLWQREWLQGAVLEEQLTYWKERLTALPVLELPTDRPRPPVRGMQGRELPLLVSSDVMAALKDLSRQEGATLFMTLLAALQILLSRYTEQEAFGIGTPISNRTRVETEGLIGFFANTLVLRCGISSSLTFRELLAQVRESTLDAYRHQDLPFEQLVELLQPERSLSYTPLFQVMLVLQNAPPEALRLPGVIVQPLELANETAKYDLTFSMTERPEGLVGSLNYATDLFDEATIQRMIGHFLTLLGAIIEEPDRAVGELPILTAAEEQNLLVTWNAGALPTPSGERLPDLIGRQVDQTPDAIALVTDDAQLTYAELHRCSNRLARYLQQWGVGPEKRVGICLQRSVAMVVGILAVLKAGGAYVPLDATYPPARLRFIMQDAGLSLLLTQSWLIDRFEEAMLVDGVKALLLDRDQEAIASQSAKEPYSTATDQNLAYVIYTSGSTGRPKGVAIEHRSAVALLHWAASLFSDVETAGVLSSTSIGFDLSVFELFVPLSKGGAIILAENALQLPHLRAASQVTLLNTVPSAAAALLQLQAIPSTVRTINLAGEALAVSLAQRLYDATSAERVYNLYGPTEDTTYSTYALIARGASEVTIGRPLVGTQIYLLNARMQLVPVGIPGELYIGGAGLARGYFGRGDLTAERFVPHPFAAQPGVRLYRTGDRARYLPDGRIDLLGRTDNQVKVRGFRIELDEVEAALITCEALREAVVTAPADSLGERKLVAYVVPEVEQVALIEGLRASLQQKLPAYMIPATFVVLNALPRTPNGKVDRQALPTSDVAQNHTRAAYAPPRTPLEELLLSIWSEVLGIKQIGIHDHFFHLGGHSLLAVNLVARIRERLRIDLPLRQLFEAPTVEQLAERIRRFDHL